MKAREVNENSEFKRGLKPKNVLGIGMAGTITADDLTLFHDSYTEIWPDIKLKPGDLINKGVVIDHDIDRLIKNQKLDAASSQKLRYLKDLYDSGLLDYGEGRFEYEKHHEWHYYSDVKFPLVDTMNEYAEFKRGQDVSKSLRIGKYRPGTPKEFSDVRVGDTAIDYNGEKYSVIDKEHLTIIDPWYGKDSILRFDSTGAMYGLLTYPEDHGHEIGDKINLIAVSNDVDNYVFEYGEHGAYAIW